MSELNITVGNWFVETNSAGSIEVYTDGGKYLSIGIVTEDDDCTGGSTAKANAHLISAAPEMYEMLESIYLNACNTGDTSDELEDIKLLLDKARGNQ